MVYDCATIGVEEFLNEEDIRKVEGMVKARVSARSR